MESVYCSCSFWRYVFNDNINAIPTEMSPLLIIRMPNWVLVPEKQYHTTFLVYIFILTEQKNNTTIPLDWRPGVHTHELTRDSKKETRWIFYSSNYWKLFFGSTLFFIFFYKKTAVNHSVLADEKVVTSTMFRSPIFTAEREWLLLGR
jgi:hypothetical protein